MDTKLVRRRVTTVLLVSAVLLVLAGLALLSLVSGSSAEFGESWRIIIFINVAGALTLVLLIVGNLIRMYRDYRNRAAGSRLKTRLVTAFVALVIVPMAIVYSYAVQFLNEGIDSWFDLRVEQGLGDALELSRTALEVRMLDNMEETRGIAAGLYNLIYDTSARSRIVHSLRLEHLAYDYDNNHLVGNTRDDGTACDNVAVASDGGGTAPGNHSALANACDGHGC